MKFYQSKIGYILSLLYLFLATAIIISDLGRPPSRGNWVVNLDFCGLLARMVVYPSLLTFELLFESLGIPPVTWSCRSIMISDYLQLIFHLVMTAVYFYFIGYGIEWLFRRLRRS